MKKFSLLLAILLVIVSLTACSSGKTTADTTADTTAETTYTVENPLVLSLAFNTGNSTQPGCGSFARFEEKMYELSGGTVVVEEYPDGALGKTTEAIVGGIQNGSLDFAIWSVGGFAEYSKAFMPLDVPYLLLNDDDAEKAIKLGEPAEQAMSQRLLEDTGIKLLYCSPFGFRQITNSVRPIAQPSDLEGMKIRTQSNPLHILGMEAFGCSAVPINFSELFTSLQQGVVDGQENPLTTIYQLNFDDVQKYLTVSNHLYHSVALIMNDEYFNSLPSEIQGYIEIAAAEAQEWGFEDYYEQKDMIFEELGKTLEIEVLDQETLVEFQDIAKQKWPEMKETIGADYFDTIYNLIYEK